MAHSERYIDIRIKYDQNAPDYIAKKYGRMVLLPDEQGFREPLHFKQHEPRPWNHFSEILEAAKQAMLEYERRQGERVLCDICGKDAVCMTGKELYVNARPEYADKHFWVCRGCDAHVGCHPKTTQPLGSLVDREVRAMRTSAHKAFDQLWKTKKMTRKAAYDWLADALGIAVENCHIGQFYADTCSRVVTLSMEKMRSL